MKKVITYILMTLVFLIFAAGETHAQSVSDSSAGLKAGTSSLSYDYRVENLKNFLSKFNSPLANYAEVFVANADSNNLDYRLVPSISGVESTFGKFIPSSNSYNAYGWAQGKYKFQSWPDSIATVSAALKNNYIDKGAASVQKIAKRYSPPSSTWGRNVQFFMRKIDTLPLSFDLSG